MGSHMLDSYLILLLLKTFIRLIHITYHNTDGLHHSFLVKKMMFSALKKMAIHGENWHFSVLKVGSWAMHCSSALQGSWATFSAETSHASARDA